MSGRILSDKQTLAFSSSMAPVCMSDKDRPLMHMYSHILSITY